MNVNTVNFGDIIKEISHGLMAESYISDNEFTKPCEYLRLVDIDDGVIAENCIGKSRTRSSSSAWCTPRSPCGARRLSTA